MSYKSDTKLTQCSYYYHTWSNAIPRRCIKADGHIGDHEEEPLMPTPPQQNFHERLGWHKR